ncbi:4'-phosphopantetheinyl transferase family protein [Polaribacter porphyrae]|uniref:4'-phosphopantetheinyl transferase domain-containing protein n=1 Tax=Polaribacter porphyrae TaxID=1137780 RepID=A0A2S7WRF2_9FLAO|nr:4'-phosphopantetheinyl transferase superfamily protein [Polaribacter porphyrae]PQJ79891.1 hypothetical protein BTO18_12220 [Polaribacter porphyrae]
MLNIGNDIIDLQLAKTESDWQRIGFLEKQFTEKEQKEIYNSENPFLKVWLFWSMKEAAYKCYTQKVKKRFFAPQKFECLLTKEDEGVVTFQNTNFYTTTFFDASYIHTIAEDKLIKGGHKIRVFLGVGSPNNLDKDITKRLQENTGILSSEIEKRKIQIGVPQFYHHHKFLTNSCSISHHGNYGAYAFIINGN